MTSNTLPARSWGLLKQAKLNQTPAPCTELMYSEKLRKLGKVARDLDPKLELGCAKQGLHYTL